MKVNAEQVLVLKQVQKLAPELSYKIMQIGEAVLQIEEEYLHVIEDEELKQKIKTASKLLMEITEQMQEHHAERMLNWKKHIKAMAQQGFI